MIPAKLPPLLVDADPCLRRLCLPPGALSRLRAMRVGDVLILTEFEAPGHAGANGFAGVALTKMRGYFDLESCWTAHLGKNAWKRPPLWWSVQFKLRPGRQLELLQRDCAGGDFRLAGLRQAALVLRRTKCLARWAKREGNLQAAVALEPSNLGAQVGPEAEALSWLETLRGPEPSPSESAQHTD